MAKHDSKRNSAPMFHDYVDDNNVAMSTNAHPDREYESRMPEESIVTVGTDGDIEVSNERVGCSPGARRQVLNQIGQRNGTMTFQSLIGKEKR